MIAYFSLLLDILKHSLDSINEDMFDKLVNESIEALNNANKIIVSGLGKNVPICDKFVGTMTSLGLNAQFLHTNSAVHGDLGIVRESDLVIVLSKSGETKESIYLTHYLEAKKANIWLLSFSDNSTLSRKIKKSILLDLKHEGDLWNIVPNNSTTINLIVLQALAIHIAKSLDLKLDVFKQNHPGGNLGEILSNE